MVRVSTIKRLTKDALLDIFIKSLEHIGSDVSIKSNSIYPVELCITTNYESEKIILYIMNISHGGKTRSENEYRIQISGKPPLETSEEAKTLLIGWYEELKVFAAFDAEHHKNFGKSPSLQVVKEKLQEGHDKGIAFQIKRTPKGDDVVIVFSPMFILNYIDELYQRYHAHSKQSMSQEEESLLKKEPLNAKISKEELDKLSRERRTALIVLNKKLRESKFREIIFRIYNGKCALCNLQLRLTEAAHIIPVNDDGLDEITNGILLCRNHHKAYDSGLLGINKEYKVIINRKAINKLKDAGLGGQADKFVKEINEKINLPDNPEYYPNRENLEKNCKLRGIN